MEHAAPADAGLPALLSTQLLAAEVYAYFLTVSSQSERALWGKLLEDELEHVFHVRSVLHREIPEGIELPAANTEKMRETCAFVTRQGGELFLLRLEGALRLECAELDYGLEGLLARRLSKSTLIPDYRFDIMKHLLYLLDTSERYMESPNIGMQVRRLHELLETSLRDSSSPSAEENFGFPGL